MSVPKSVCLWLAVWVSAWVWVSGESDIESGIKLLKQLKTKSDHKDRDAPNPANSTECRLHWKHRELRRAYTSFLNAHLDETVAVEYDLTYHGLLRDTSKLLNRSQNHYEEGPTSSYTPLKYPPTCPFLLNPVTRLDRYPFKIKHAVCNCTHCIDSNNSQLSCQLYEVAKPVLERRACDEAGFHKWTFAYELVPIKCSCRRSIEFPN